MNIYIYICKYTYIHIYIYIYNIHMQCKYILDFIIIRDILRDIIGYLCLFFLPNNEETFCGCPKMVEEKNKFSSSHNRKTN